MWAENLNLGGTVLSLVLKQFWVLLFLLYVEVVYLFFESLKNNILFEKSVLNIIFDKF